MGMPKGVSGNPNGRPKNVPNKSTEAMRNVLADFFHRNAGELDALFHQIKAESPKEAFKAVMETAEFVMPKLARVESKNETNLTADVNISLTESDRELISRYHAEKVTKQIDG